jgi:hypothetical protein
VVIIGCYLPWATFYDGLYRPDGVSGHGRFFIGLAVAALAAALLAEARPSLPSLRWAVPLAGAIVASVALRDLWNLEQLLASPEAVLYFPGRGPGLYLVAAGASALLLAPLAAPASGGGGAGSLALAAGRWAIVAGLALLVPGLYGDYFMHLGAGGVESAHAHHGAMHVLSPDHLLTASGAGLALMGVTLEVLTARTRRSK